MPIADLFLVMAVSSTYLKGLCHEEAAVLGQFCAEVIIWSLFPQKNALLEIIVWVIFAGKALKPEKLGHLSSFNLYPSLSSLATNN